MPVFIQLSVFLEERCTVRKGEARLNAPRYHPTHTTTEPHKVSPIQIRGPIPTLQHPFRHPFRALIVLTNRMNPILIHSTPQHIPLPLHNLQPPIILPPIHAQRRTNRLHHPRIQTLPLQHMRMLQRPIHPAQMHIIRPPPMLIKAKLAAIEHAPVADIGAVLAVLEGHAVAAPGAVALGGIALVVDAVGEVVRERVVLVEVVGAGHAVGVGHGGGCPGGVGVGVAVAVGFVEDVGRGGPGGAVFPAEGWEGVKEKEEKGEESGGEHGVGY